MRKILITLFSLIFATSCSEEKVQLENSIVEIYYDGVKAIEVTNGIEKEIKLPKEKAGANITWLIQRPRP